MLKSIKFAIGCIVLSLMLCACGATNGASSVLDEFCSAVNKGNLEKALACCDSETAELARFASGTVGDLLGTVGMEINSDKLMNEFIPQILKLTGVEGKNRSYQLKTKDITEETIDDTHALVKGTWIVDMTANGSTETQEYPLELVFVKEESGWKIDFSETTMTLFESLLGLVSS